MNEKSDLQRILNLLDEGQTFGKWERGGTFHFVLWKTKVGNIGWNHFGSSANKFNLESLDWILSVIFEMTAEEFEKKYALRRM